MSEILDIDTEAEDVITLNSFLKQHEEAIEEHLNNASLDEDHDEIIKEHLKDLNDELSYYRYVEDWTKKKVTAYAHTKAVDYDIYSKMFILRGVEVKTAKAPRDVELKTFLKDLVKMEPDTYNAIATNIMSGQNSNLFGVVKVKFNVLAYCVAKVMECLGLLDVDGVSFSKVKKERFVEMTINKGWYIIGYKNTKVLNVVKSDRDFVLLTSQHSLAKDLIYDEVERPGII